MSSKNIQMNPVKSTQPNFYSVWRTCKIISCENPILCLPSKMVIFEGNLGSVFDFEDMVETWKKTFTIKQKEK